MKLNITFTDKQIEFLNSNKKYVVVTKGRRFGATKGLANYFIKCCLKNIYPLLWVDTINGNIDRYFERYFVPVLKENNIPYDYNVQKKVLKIGNGYIDFRSADNPSSIEGFGYKKIFLNEAGIILKNEYLYTNAILPMLMDYPDSQLISAGVPKGKYLKNGQEHPFYILYERGMSGNPDYAVFEYSSYDNPFLNQLDVQALEAEMASMSEIQVQQEIYGKFVEYSGNNPFLYNFDDVKHIGKASIDPRKRIIISVDFNLDPMCAIVAQTDFINEVNIIDEIVVNNANIGKFIDEVKARYKPYLNTMLLTGDAMGKQRNLSIRENFSNYDQIRNGLMLNSRQIDVKSNPTHDNSRSQCNYFLAHFPKFTVSDNCTGVIRDLKYVQADGTGHIIKANRKDVNQQSDQLDNFRYLINTFFSEWITKHQKSFLHLKNGTRYTDPKIREAINRIANDGFNA